MAIPPPFFAQRCNWHLEQYRFPCCNGTVLFLPTLLLSDSPGGTKKCARKGERPKRYLGRQIDPLHARGAIAACIGGGDSDDAKPQKFHRRRRPNDIAAGFFLQRSMRWYWQQGPRNNSVGSIYLATDHLLRDLAKKKFGSSITPLPSKSDLNAANFKGGSSFQKFVTVWC